MKTIKYVIRAKLEGKIVPGQGWYDWGFYEKAKEAKERLKYLVEERPHRKFKAVKRTIIDEPL